LGKVNIAAGIRRKERKVGYEIPSSYIVRNAEDVARRVHVHLGISLTTGYWLMADKRSARQIADPLSAGGANRATSWMT